MAIGDIVCLRHDMKIAMTVIGADAHEAQCAWWWNGEIRNYVFPIGALVKIA